MKNYKEMITFCKNCIDLITIIKLNLKIVEDGIVIAHN
ncbi:MAG: hypothetical protein JWQ84_2306 [Mucilaginibacter sp.]|nr:hypothetical protein [Mucilaginibacter sp.]